jgi:hypothetical protein
LRTEKFIATYWNTLRLVHKKWPAPTYKKQISADLKVCEMVYYGMGAFSLDMSTVCTVRMFQTYLLPQDGHRQWTTKYSINEYERFQILLKSTV